MPIDFAPHNMTGPNSPAPYHASDPGHFTIYAAWAAFDGATGTTGYCILDQASIGGFPTHIVIDLGAGQPYILGSYALHMNTVPEPNRAPKNFTMQGSNDNISYTVLDTQTNQTAWGSGETRTYTIASPGSTAYRWLKIVITANNGDANYTDMSEMYFYAGAATTVTEAVGGSAGIGNQGAGQKGFAA